MPASVFSVEDTPVLSICSGTRVTDFIRFIRMKAALRVPLAVTWLTVYRQLHIMRAWARAGGLGPEVFWQDMPPNLTSS